MILITQSFLPFKFECKEMFAFSLKLYLTREKKTNKDRICIGFKKHTAL